MAQRTKYLTPFPTEPLGRLLEDVVKAIQQETGAETSSIVSAVLVAVSLVCQGRIRIRKRQGLVSPVSLWFIVAQGSGERKTSLLRLALKAIYDFSAEQLLSYKVKLGSFNDSIVSWKAEEKGILTSIRKKTSKNLPIDEDQERLRELNARKPKRPRQFKLLHEKMTPLALVKDLAECYPTTGLISDEAATVFCSRGMNDFGLLNKAFDGSTLSVDRASEESLIAVDPCLTVALYVQPEILDDYLNGNGKQARASGLLARSYMVETPDRAGSRYLAYSVPASPEVMNKYFNRCSEILQSHINVDSGDELPEKIELFFSPEAQCRWEKEHDKIESLMLPGYIYFNDKDFASKHADKIARLAALLHFFEGQEGPISLETLERAIHISAWYAGSFVHNFAEPIPIPQEVIGSNVLLCWFAEQVRVFSATMFKKTDILRNGPPSVRNALHLNAALRVLWQQNIVSETHFPGDKTTYVLLNQSYFTPEQVQYLCLPSTISMLTEKGKKSKKR